MTSKLAIDAVIFDLDGTVYLGNEAIHGAVTTITALRSRGVRTLFVSNKPLEPRRAYADKLSRLGIPTAEEEVLTSAYVMGSHLSAHSPQMRLFVVGEESLQKELRSYGLNVIEDDLKTSGIDPSCIDAVIVAFDRTLDYRKLNTAYQALLRGARFYATNADKVCPVPGGTIPDAGATLAALEHITGRQVELLAGKPSRIITDVALDTLRVTPERCLMVGDRLDTDIRMGREAGMFTAVVLTGITTRQAAETSEDAPTLILENISELLQWIG